jgi:DNA-binding transcriptional LysR family regulator
MRNNVELGDIEAFAAVGHALSFKLAAETLSISPSALSRRVQKLEERLGVRLLERTTRDVRLTLQGKELLARTQDILASVDEVVTALKGEAPRRTATITVATIPSITHQLLPAVIHAFNKRHPTTRVRIKDMTTNEIFDLVLRGEADFGITSFLPHDAGLQFAALLRGKFVLVTPRTHALAKRKSMRWAELRDHRVISTWKGAGVRVAMDLDLAKSSNGVSTFYEVQQIYTALRFVEAGLGVAAVPAFFIGARERAALGVIPLSEPVVTAELGTVVSRNHPLRRQALEFWQLTHEICNASQRGGKPRLDRPRITA